jgi:hypothetical protein
MLTRMAVPNFALPDYGLPEYALPGAAGGAPLALADDAFSNSSPFDLDESIDTVAATGGTPPYQYEILSQTLL